MNNVKIKDENALRAEAVRRLRTVIDPELGVNIVDLGLIYQICLERDTLIVTYTITTAGCPMRRYLQKKIDEELQAIEGIDLIETRVVFDPEWSVDMIKVGVDFFSVPPPKLSEDFIT